jgi:gluconolactonase
MKKTLALFFVFQISAAFCARAQTIARHDPRFDKLIPPGAVLEKLDANHEWVEGPVWDKKNQRLLFSDIPRNAIYEWREGKAAAIFMQPSGYTGSAKFEGREPGSNGLTFDAQGRLTLCEHGDRRVARLEADGKKTTLADRFEGKRLNSPNDLAFRKNGDLYFTDPPYGLPKTFNDPQRELDFLGVYRLTPDGKLSAVIRDLPAPNGIAFSPDEKILYIAVSDPKRAVWMAYDVKDDGTVANGRVFFDASEWAKTKKGLPDGMKIDAHGNIFGAGPGGFHIFAPDGTHLGAFEFSVPVSNCNWGDDGSTLYMTANTEVYRIKTATKGEGW